MFLKKTLSKIFATAALAVSLALSPMVAGTAIAQEAQPAVASAQQQQVINELETGRYYTAAQISAHLQAEGHQPVTFMNLELIDTQSRSIREISALLTADSDGNFYLLQGNQPQGQSTHFALAMKGTDLQVHDYRTKTRPDFVNRNYDRSQFRTEASAIAQQIGLSITALFYDDAIDSAESLDLYIVAQGRSENGGVLTLAANPDNNAFSLVTTYPGRGGVTTEAGKGGDFSVSRQIIAQFDAEQDAGTQYARVAPGTIRQP